MTSGAGIRIERDGAVATIVMDDAARLNAITLAMAEALPAAIRQVAEAGCGALVLTGEGRAFCAGAAIDALDPSQDGYDAGRALESHYNPLVRAVWDSPIPIVSAVNGVAAGIGCSLALGADIVVAAVTAQFLQPFLRIGLVPDTGISFLLTRALGRARAMELLLLGEPLGAREAQACGLVNRVTAQDRLREDALAIARRLADGPRTAIALARQQVNAALTSDIETMLGLERAQQAIAGCDPDHAEGLRALAGRRKPVFGQEPR